MGIFACMFGLFGLFICSVGSAQSLNQARQPSTNVSFEDDLAGEYSTTMVDISLYRKWLGNLVGSLEGMQVDHIIPKKMGGIDHSCNYMPIPGKLNNAFGDMVDSTKAFAVGFELFATALACTRYFGGNFDRKGEFQPFTGDKANSIIKQIENELNVNSPSGNEAARELKDAYEKAIEDFETGELKEEIANSKIWFDRYFKFSSERWQAQERIMQMVADQQGGLTTARRQALGSVCIAAGVCAVQDKLRVWRFTGVTKDAEVCEDWIVDEAVFEESVGAIEAAEGTAAAELAAETLAASVEALTEATIGGVIAGTCGVLVVVVVVFVIAAHHFHWW